MTTDEKLRKALEQIKGLVTGDKIPNWQDHWRTTSTRARIADIADAALVPAPPESRDTPPLLQPGDAVVLEMLANELDEETQRNSYVDGGRNWFTYVEAIRRVLIYGRRAVAASGAAGATTAAAQERGT